MVGQRGRHGDPIMTTPTHGGPAGRPDHRLAQLWRRFTQPPEDLAPDQEHRARLLLAMATILVPLMLVLGVLVSWDPLAPLGWDLQIAALVAAVVVVLLISHVLVHSGRYRLGSHVLVGGIWWLLVLELVVLADPIDPWIFTYLLLPGFLSSILLTVPATLSISGASIGVLLIQWQRGQTTGSPELVVYLFVLLTAVAVAAHTLQNQDRRRIVEQSARLEASEQRIRRLLNATFEAVVLHDGPVIVDANPTFQTLFGLPLEDARGRGLYELLAAEDETAWVSVRDHVAGATTGSVEAIGVQADGQRFPVECRSRPLEAGSQGLRVTVLRDISHRKAIEEARANRAQEAARRAELEQLVWVTSHTLRTPVRTVNSFSQLLDRQLEGRLDPEAAESLAYLQRGTAELDRLLSDLREYGEVVTRDAPHLPVPLRVTVEQALGDLRDQVAVDEAEIHIGPLPTVAGDAVQLEHLFRELLENALVHHGGSQPQVEVRAREEGSHHRIEVRDDGPGIPEELRERALGIFQRLGTDRTGLSTGVGLALARRIAEAHGGSLHLTDTPGAETGTTVVVSLPKLAAR